MNDASKVANSGWWQAAIAKDAEIEAANDTVEAVKNTPDYSDIRAMDPPGNAMSESLYEYVITFRPSLLDYQLIKEHKKTVMVLPYKESLSLWVGENINFKDPLLSTPHGKGRDRTWTSNRDPFGLNGRVISVTHYDTLEDYISAEGWKNDSPDVKSLDECIAKYKRVCEYSDTRQYRPFHGKVTAVKLSMSFRMLL